LSTYYIKDESYAVKVQKVKKRLRALGRDKVFGGIVGMIIRCGDELGKVEIWLRGAVVDIELSWDEVKKFGEFIESLGFKCDSIKEKGVTIIPEDTILCQSCKVPTVFSRMNEEVEWRKCLRCGGLVVVEV